ncbi:branched-chain amino acid aminotransferase [Rhizobium leguminosarum bv. viciae]|nr:branched-chain amino acid aminotransferase [Rhizobium leguminosarum bv. viciae]
MHPSTKLPLLRTNIAAWRHSPAFSCFRVSARDLSLTRLAAAVFPSPASGGNHHGRRYITPFNHRTHVDGEWLPGNPPLIGPTSHAMWLGSTVFDGARWFDGIAPDLDLHCQRINRSALAMGLKPVKSAEEIVALAREGVAKFDGATPIYIKPMYWGEHGSPGSVVSVDGDSTRFALCLFEAPMGGHGGTSLTVSPYRRPSPETAMTEAKTGSLYPNSGRMIAEARSRGFDNALVRDLNGNVVETASSNVFMVRDGVVMTPAANRTFLAGITRSRVISLLRKAGFDVHEATLSVEDFMQADEIFTTGNYSKVVGVIRLDGRDLRKARSPARRWNSTWTGPSAEARVKSEPRSREAGAIDPVNRLQGRTPEAQAQGWRGASASAGCSRLQRRAS